MSKDGFEQDDLSSTLARFAGKGRSIVHDESKLKRKAQEPVAFSSATQDLGRATLALSAKIVMSAVSQRNESDDSWGEWRYGPQGYGHYIRGRRVS